MYVLGGAEAVFTDFYVSFSDDWFPDEGKSIRKAADRAFGLAGVTRDDIDVVGSYDCFTVTGLRNLEEMGFCGIGEGAAYVKEGHTRLGGKMPVNPDGGLLSNSHCGDPSGLMVVEVVKQLRGECGRPAGDQTPRSASPSNKVSRSTASAARSSWASTEERR